LRCILATAARVFTIDCILPLQSIAPCASGTIVSWTIVQNSRFD
jgi:hypothetical protein